MSRKVLSIVILLSIAFASCSSNGGYSKASYMKNYESLVVKMENDFMTLSDEQFEERMDELVLYGTDYYESVKRTLTEEEKQQVGRLQARCTKIAISRGIDRGSEELDDFMNVASGFFDELMKK